jgi:hypothetical protein
LLAILPVRKAKVRITGGKKKRHVGKKVTPRPVPRKAIQPSRVAPLCATPIAVARRMTVRTSEKTSITGLRRMRLEHETPAVTAGFTSAA